MRVQAMAVSGVFDDGFHKVRPRRPRRCAAFQDQTATGKLKAETTPTTPAGAHCSYIPVAGTLGVHVVRP